jgi:hypothetical protein
MAVGVALAGAPTIGKATAGNASATATFTAPASNGGSPITLDNVTATPGGLTPTGSGSPLRVTGLANATAYSFVVRATNAAGVSAPSKATKSVTPKAG